MRFLNPKTDFAFKKIFGSIESPDILVSFLNAILALHPPHQITDVQIMDPYLAPKIKGMKDTYLDVRVKDQSERNYIIEMQVLNVAGFEKRVLYNACKTFAGQIQQGEPYYLLTNVVAVTITDFVMFEELGNPTNRFMLRSTECTDVCLDDLELVFAELPKFTKGEGHLENQVDKWFYFLKHAGVLQAIPKALADEPAILKAFAIANKAALTPEELEDQERRELFIQDQRGALIFAEQRGEQKGIEKGIEIGELRGIFTGKAGTLLRLIQRRFGQPPAWVHDRLADAGLETLDTWTDHILDAATLEDVFKPMDDSQDV
ncbi:MAG: hypothetical protein HW380_1837 [Magnetococcales bacterium]|nr:hypothetical protein [Magnetococcales bacterium]HIJ83698.1 Rpn family recombination-promoting nuclease/putative transposase [Magnetococcales bacterium]